MSGHGQPPFHAKREWFNPFLWLSMGGWCLSGIAARLVARARSVGNARLGEKTALWTG